MMEEAPVVCQNEGEESKCKAAGTRGHLSIQSLSCSECNQKSGISQALAEETNFQARFLWTG